LLTECLVADCWGLESFKAAPKALRAPFWICYRPGDVHTVSAFGGSEVPKDISDRSRPGIFYRKKREWQCVEYLEGEQDAGVVIITYRAELHSLEIALIGFTGAATAAVGKEFLERPDRFWPPGSKKGDRQIGVYLCKFAKKAGTAKQCYDNCEVQSLDVALTPA
jgi:hypothetical protein